MSATKQLNSKTNLKQQSSGDLPFFAFKNITQRMPVTTSVAGQTIINLPFAVDLSIKDAFILVIDGRPLGEGSSNDYTFTAVQANNTSSQVTLTQTLTAGLPIWAMYLGVLVQQEPNVNSLQAQINNLSGTNGASGINYIAAPDAEKSITGWTRFQNAAAVTPVSGTGGSPNASVTFAQSTSSPLRGTASFLLTKDAQNRQGEGVSYDFAIDSTDKASMLSISMDFAGSANFVSGSASDIQVWIYDKDAGQLIQPAPYTLAQPKGKFQTTFQTSASSVNYRLIFYIATTNSLAWTFTLDNVQVGPQSVSRGCPVTDWTAYTPTFTGLGTVSAISAFWRRVGDTVEVKGAGTVGTPTATAASVSLPSVAIDTVKISAATNGQLVGEALAAQTSTTALYGSNTAFVAFFDGVDTANIYFASSSGATSATLTKMNGNSGNSPVGSRFEFKFSVPVQGWSSTVQMSNDTDTRVVAAQIGLAIAVTPTSNTAIKYDTVLKDTHGAYNAASGLYTAPVAGVYRVSVNQECNGAAGIYISRNGSGVVYLMSTANALNQSGSSSVTCNAGDTIGVFTDTSRTFGAAVSGIYQNYLSIERQSGPSAIASSENVCARYTGTNGQTIASGGSDTVVDFNNKDYDSHGAVTTGSAWKFKAPIAGKYSIKAAWVSSNSFTSTVNNSQQLYLYKNGTLFSTLSYVRIQASSSGMVVHVMGSDTINLLAGDFIDIRIYQDASASSVTANSSGLSVHVAIERVGN
jgi:hypothetical protein